MNQSIARDDLERGKARRRARDAQQDDPFRKRQSTVAFWRRCLLTNPGYSEPQSRALYRHPGFIRFLLPRTRAYIEAQRKAARDAWYAELAEHSRQAAEAKALRIAAKAGQVDLFEATP
jgi:hypothetical protein